ncbi:MAG: serine hydrolase [Sphingomonadaceae bacterium]|nr:serine hydrolase [Sphingomonadaceae bacterium]
MIAAPATAQGAPVSPQLQARAGEMVAFLNGAPVPDRYFSAGFLAEIPVARVASLGEQLRAEHGAVESISIAPDGASAGTVTLEYERATATAHLVLEPAPPHRVTGLLISDVAVRGDSFAALAEDFAALPGRAGFVVARVGEGGPTPIAAHNADTPLAIGSGFKLYVLAEAARQVAAGERRWDEVIALGPASRPSGVTQDWPAGSPLTLHSLAALMISISDNTATDTLMSVLGRNAIDRIVAIAGHADPARAVPLLTTREAFALKAPANADLRNLWTAADAEARRALLRDHAERLTPTAPSLAEMGGAPAAIDSVEWFASPADLARALDWLRREGGETALAILAINRGAAGEAVSRWRYLGFKGGSEIGVISASYLIEDEAGAWFALSASWNDPAAALDEARFRGLMMRALRLVDAAPAP